MKIRTVVIALGLMLGISGFINAQGFTPVSSSDNSVVTVPAGLQRSYADIILEIMASGSQNRFLDGIMNPEAYIIGPGDKFQISFVSDIQPDINCQVNSSGNAFVKSIGLIELGHISLQASISKLTKALKKNFSGIDFTIQLSEFRFTRVNLIGRVKNPGTYYAPATWRVSEVITLAGGLIPGASLRSIELSGFGKSYNVDLTRYRSLGDLAANPMICAGNTIHIPEAAISTGYVSVSGQVSRPGIFEYRDGDTVIDYIDFCEGISSASSDLRMIVYSPSEDKEQTSLLADDGWKSIPLHSGDNIIIDWVEGKKTFGSVIIVGAVSRPGTYKIKSDEYTLANLMDNCSGVNENACLERIQIYRLQLKTSDNGISNVISSPEMNSGWGSQLTTKFIVSNNARQGTAFQQLPLKAGDSVFVPTKTGVITVTGAAASPGIVPFYAGKNADYYIGLAGGYGHDANQHGTVVINPVTGGKLSLSQAGSLFDGEIIYIPRKESNSK
ncbi:MAG: SLBB domain-containing protein [candidate division Zixibacteria bacterium]|nr:SLBB domain-containing protein [candidate division Zixibacteria bacterium]